MLTVLFETLISRAIDHGRPVPRWLRPILALSPALRRYEADARRVDAALARGAQAWRDVPVNSGRMSGGSGRSKGSGGAWSIQRAMLAAAACLAVAAILWFAAPDPRPARPLAIDPQLHQQWLALTLQAGEARAAAGDQLAIAAALPTEVFATLDRTTAQLTQGAAAEIDALTMDLRSSFDFLLQPIAPWTGPRDDDTPTNPAPETEMPSDRPV